MSECSQLSDKPTSPLDVEGIDLGITTEEIIQAIRESRERA